MLGRCPRAARRPLGTANLGKDEEQGEKVLKPNELTCKTLLLPCALLPVLGREVAGEGVPASGTGG